MKYCQGPDCHTYRTKDRIRGSKGDKHYETRKRSSMPYIEWCSVQCYNDWLNKFGTMALDHFGRVTEAKRVGCDSAWYKDSKYNYNNGSNSNYDHYIVNDLLGRRIPITEQQYNNCNDNNIKDLIIV